MSLNNLVLLTEHPDLEEIITRQDTSTGNSTEDVSTSTLEERLSTFLGNNLTESVERRVILDSGTRGHHHTTTNGINGVRSYFLKKKKLLVNNNLTPEKKKKKKYIPRPEPVVTAQPKAKVAKKDFWRFSGRRGLRES